MDSIHLSPIPGFVGQPRSVPLAVRTRVLFGGFLNQFGWLFFGFGMIFAWVFVPLADFAPLTFRGELATAEARVTAVEKTRASEGGGKHSSGTPIYANHYVFERAGRSYAGISYTTGNRVNESQAVTVEFPPATPEISRLRGQRANVFAIWVVFVVLFPAVGLAFVAAGLRHGLRGRRLLAGGLVSEGKLVRKTATGATVNDQPVYALDFEFRARDGRVFGTTAKSHRPELLEDESAEPLLYDPADPSEAVLLDALPGSPRLDASGVIRLERPGSAAAVLVLPLLSVVGHCGYMLWLVA